MSGSIFAKQTQFAQATKRRGAPVILRKSQNTGGRNPVPIPPILENPTIGVAALAGAEVISVAAATANGALISGDQIAVDGNTYTVTAQTASTGYGSATPGIPNIPITPALIGNIAVGDAVTLSYASDQPLYGVVGSFRFGLIDGTVIQVADLQIILAALNLATGQLITPPKGTDKLILNGQQLGIIACIPEYIMGQVISYRIQARG